jgi:hypothetical protein
MFSTSPQDCASLEYSHTLFYRCPQVYGAYLEISFVLTGFRCACPCCFLSGMGRAVADQSTQAVTPTHGFVQILHVPLVPDLSHMRNPRDLERLPLPLPRAALPLLHEHVSQAGRERMAALPGSTPLALESHLRGAGLPLSAHFLSCRRSTRDAVVYDGSVLCVLDTPGALSALPGPAAGWALEQYGRRDRDGCSRSRGAAGATRAEAP